jgi:hypothetical protein
MILGRDITRRIEVSMQLEATGTTDKTATRTAVVAGGMPTAATGLRGMSRVNRNHRATPSLGFLFDKGFQQYTHAAQHYAESLPLFRALGDQHGIAWGLHNLGQIALAEGDALKAAALFKESLVLCRDLGAKVGIAYGLAGMASVAVMLGQLPRAARLLGAVEALLAAIRGRLNAADHVAYMRNIDTVRMALDRSTLEAVWQHGRKYTVEQAIIEALDAFPARWCAAEFLFVELKVVEIRLVVAHGCKPPQCKKKCAHTRRLRKA